MSQKRWVTLEKKNDWGHVYYAEEGKGLTALGMASTSRGLPLRSAQPIRVRWPDGQEELKCLVAQRCSRQVSDHGHPVDVVSSLFGVISGAHGAMVWVELTTPGLEVLMCDGDLADREWD